jgi:hypothetical protein
MEFPSFNRMQNDLCESHERATLASVSATVALGCSSGVLWLVKISMHGQARPVQMGLVTNAMICGSIGLIAWLWYIYVSRQHHP